MTSSRASEPAAPGSPIEVVTAPALLGESPLWSPREGVLYYCDIAGRALHRYNPADGSDRSWTFESEPACCALAEGGALLLARRDGLWHFDPASGASRRLAPPPYDPTVERFNDGRVDAQGRWWIGTLYEPRQPALAALYCFERGVLRRVRGDVTVSNGLAFSPAGDTLYWADTTRHTIFALPYDGARGQPGARRVLRCFERRAADQPLADYGGRPDGAAIDSEGAYWVAMYEGARLLRLAPSGDILCELRLPVQCPTMPCFGAADLRTLYITTARLNRPADELSSQPAAGCVLAVRVDVPGLPPGQVEWR
ncbi:SMP-30/gluconolactonase/LRE family protein [Aquabacterium sp.]|uniref:SMP-30/gluconolactonase/LRE family protein n=1 Tax=Aquabacterium sp. TaxID=1872578 RepID=UPI0035AD8B7E